MKRYTIVFLCVLLLSTAVVAAGGYALRHWVLEPMGLEREEHIIALPFVLLEDEVLQFQVRKGWETVFAEAEDADHEEQADVAEPAATPTPTPEPTPVYMAVEESWFDDALFIGDSRTYGLKGMGRLGDADYFCEVGLTVYGAMKNRLSDRNFSTTNLEGLLKSNTYGKVYIHLGLNELSTGVEDIMVGYHALIDLIRQYQPDAVIVLQSCMTMTEEMGNRKGTPIGELHRLNDSLRALAESDPQLYRFSDTNAWAADENGYIRKEIVYGTCHLLGKYYTEWGQFILEDAGWYGIP